VVSTVIPKVCSADHWWSARLDQVVRGSLYNSLFCASRSTKTFLVVRASERLGTTGLAYLTHDRKVVGSNLVSSNMLDAYGVKAAPCQDRFLHQMLVHCRKIIKFLLLFFLDMDPFLYKTFNWLLKCLVLKSKSS